MTGDAKLYEGITELVEDTLHPDILELVKIYGVSKETPATTEHGKIIPHGRQYMVGEFLISDFYETTKPENALDIIKRNGDTYKFVGMARRYNHIGYIGEEFPAYVNVEASENAWILFETLVEGKYEGLPERMIYIFNSIHANLSGVEQKITDMEVQYVEQEIRNT